MFLQGTVPQPSTGGQGDANTCGLTPQTTVLLWDKEDG